jgi:uncharacterized phosphosugar-binding protein
MVCVAAPVTSAPRARLVAVEAARPVQDAGQAPPFYLSADVPAGDEHRIARESRYARLTRRTA